jgi:hypothetical protein
MVLHRRLAGSFKDAVADRARKRRPRWRSPTTERLLDPSGRGQRDVVKPWPCRHLDADR